MESSDTATVLAAVIGLVGLLSQPVVAYLLNKRPQASRLRVLVWSLGGGILAAVAIVFLAWRLLDSELEITYPPDQARVSIANDVRGSSRNLPADRGVRVVVYSFDDERYFPHETNAIFTANGSWLSQNVSIGSTADGAKQFEILILFIDAATQGNLDERIRDREFSGLDQLPEGSEVWDQVTVIRK